MNVARMYGASSKRTLAIQVFHIFMKEMLEDMIEENSILELPGYSAAFLIEKLPDHIFNNLRKQGKLDFYSTLFNNGDIFVPIYRYKKKGVCNKYRVILGNDMFTRLVTYVNQGRKYVKYTAQW